MFTSERLRAAYRIFLKDVFKREKIETDSYSHTWWSSLRRQFVDINENSGSQEPSYPGSVQIDLESRTVSFEK